MDQRLEVAFTRRRGDPDTGTNMCDPAADEHRGRDRLDDPAGDVLCFLAAGVAQHDGELIPAEAGAQVPGAGDSQESRPDLAQKVVSCSVAEYVVDALEVVEVHEQDGGGGGGGGLVLQGIRERGVEGGPVCQPGEAVRRGQSGDDLQRELAAISMPADHHRKKQHQRDRAGLVPTNDPELPAAFEGGPRDQGVPAQRRDQPPPAPGAQPEDERATGPASW